jgi:hypothetical protein
VVRLPSASAARPQVAAPRTTPPKTTEDSSDCWLALNLKSQPACAFQIMTQFSDADGTGEMQQQVLRC